MSGTQGVLEITVHKAVLTRDVCTFRTMNPFFVAYLNNSKSYKSQVRNGEGKLPFFNESFNFQADLGLNEERNLNVAVYHENSLVGQAVIDIASNFGKGGVREEEEFFLMDGDSVAGKIKIKISFQLTGNTSSGVGSVDNKSNINQMQGGHGGMNNNYPTFTNCNYNNNTNFVNNNLSNNNFVNQLGQSMLPPYNEINTQNINMNINYQQQDYNQMVDMKKMNKYNNNNNHTNEHLYDHSGNYKTIYEKLNVCKPSSNSGIQNNNNNLYSFNCNTNINPNNSGNNIYGFNTMGPNGVGNNLYSNQNNLNYNNNNQGYVGMNIHQCNSLSDNFNNMYQSQMNQNDQMMNSNMYSNSIPYQNINVNNSFLHNIIPQNVPLNNMNNNNNINMFPNNTMNNNLFQPSIPINQQNESLPLSDAPPTVSYIPDTIKTDPDVDWYQKTTSNRMSLFFKPDSTKVYLYDFKTRFFSETLNIDSLYFQRGSRATELVDGSFLISGGEEHNKPSKRVFHFFPDKGTNYEKETMNIKRAHHGAIYNQGFVYVFGGFSRESEEKESSPIDTVERLDLRNGGWKVLAKMKLPRVYPSLLNYGENYIFVFGGLTFPKVNGIAESVSIERYDIDQNLFVELNIRMQFPVYGCIVALVNSDQILIAGGYSESSKETDKAYTINPTNGNVKDLPPLSGKCWSVLPAFYIKDNSSFEIFQTGEETGDQMPLNISYTLKLQLN